MPAAAYPYCAEICFLSRQLQRYCRKPDWNFSSWAFVYRKFVFKAGFTTLSLSTRKKSPNKTDLRNNEGKTLLSR